MEEKVPPWIFVIPRLFSENLLRYYCDIVPGFNYCDHSEVIRTNPCIGNIGSYTASPRRTLPDTDNVII